MVGSAENQQNLVPLIFRCLDRRVFLINIKKSTLINTLQYLPALLPPAFLLQAIIAKVGPIPTNDYWSVISQFLTEEGLSLHLIDLLRISANEHPLAIPALIYALNIKVTNGSNYGLIVITFLIAILQFLVLAKLLAISFDTLASNRRRSGFSFKLLVFLLSVFVFTPAAAHNWMWGFSGVAWLGANFLTIGSIVSLYQAAHSPNQTAKWIWIGVSSVSALLVNFTYGTGIVVFPLLFLLALVFRLKRDFILIYGFSFIFSLTAFLHFYEKPSHHPNALEAGIWGSIKYFLIFLGGVFTNDTNYALILGLMGLILLALLLAFAIHATLSSRNNIGGSKTPTASILLPWTGIILYVLAIDLITTISRSGFGTDQAGVSRYATLPALFWISLTVFASLVSELYGVPKRICKGLYIFLLITIFSLLPSMYVLGASRVQSYSDQAKFQPLVQLALYWGINDLDFIQYSITPRPESFLKAQTAARANNIIPYNKSSYYFDSSCPPIGSKVSSERLAGQDDDKVMGYWSVFSKTGRPDVVKVSGWAAAPDQSLDIMCIVFVGSNNAIRGFALQGLHRQDVYDSLVSSSITPKSPNLGWIGYTQVLNSESLEAYVVLRGDSSLYKLEALSKP